MADTNAAFCSPVGVAWKRVRETHPSINLYSPDQSHPSAEGTYLAACVFYSTLFRASSVGALFVSSLPADTAAILQAIASSTVLDSLATWNIGVNDPNAGFTLTLIDNCTWQLHPNEQGTQFWDFGGGDTSHATEPAHFSFVASGYQSVVHTITNACGLTSTLDSTYLVCSEGIAEHPISDHIHVKQDNAMITFSGLVETDDILITDALGRTIYQRTTVNGTLVLECPPGLTIWRVTDREGRSITGRIIIP